MIKWIRDNKLAALVILVLLVWVFKNSLPVISSRSVNIAQVGSMDYGVVPSVSQKMMGGVLLPVQEAAPTTSQNRLVVSESSMSMVVANVRQVSDKIVEKAKSAGGYMVSTSLNNPEEAPFASIVVRLPSEKLKTSLDYFRTLGIRVTSENVLGTDVTDQYVDLQARLNTLNQTKAKFEEIMTKATMVADILTVQQQIINLQDQIDSLKGQQLYLEQTAKLAKMTVYLSTDEFSLPYSPSNSFRPEVIFKEAVRSLVSNSRNFAGMAIWIVVYGIIWIPLLAIVLFIWRRKKRINSLQ